MNFVLAREAQEIEKKASAWQKFKMRELGKKIYLGDEKREGWSGYLPFYLFLCNKCGRLSKDYPHGYIERQYLNCSFCEAHHDFVPWWAPWKMLLDNLRIAWKYRNSKSGERR